MDVQIVAKDGSKMLPGEGDDQSAAPSAPAADPPVPTRESQSQAANRWRREGIDGTVAAFRDRVRADYLADHPGCRRRDAHDYAWARALEQFPPPGASVPVTDPPAAVEPPAVQEPPPSSSAGGVEGLGVLPEAWPTLPANAALAVEVAWVQANRLRVVQGGTVDLSRSLSPAPSYAALAWLETSILFPAKWADVTLRATQDAQDDQADVRREKVALAEMRSLMEEAVSATL